MNGKPLIPDINDFLDYTKRSQLDFIVAITNIEFEINECEKKCDLIRAWKLYKLKLSFQKLLNKKIAHENKIEFKKPRGKH